MKLNKIIVSSILLCTSFVVPFLWNTHTTFKKDLGVQAVNLMYNFNSLQELDANMQKLEDLTTSSVYRNLDINYATRVIDAYYKFKASPSKVIIINNTPNAVCYSLENEYIDISRTFLFRYEITDGKISKVNEYEIYRGIDDYGDVSYE